MEFTKWLQDEMNKRNWSQADLARAAKLSKGSIGNVLRNERNPGAEMLNAIAKAFQMPPDLVFRIAGLLPERHELNPSVKKRIEQVTYLIEKMSPSSQEEFLQMIENIANIKLIHESKDET